MTVLDKSNLDSLTTKFESHLNSTVSLRLFTQTNSGLIIPSRKCDTCITTQKLLTEISNISNKINLEIIDFSNNDNPSTELTIDRIPATVIGQSGRAIFYGMPSGYEFSTLINSIINSSLDSQNLNEGLIKVEYQGSLYILVTNPPQAEAPKEKAKKNNKEKYF